MNINNIPLAVYNRALDLYGVRREGTLEAARTALLSAEGRIDVKADFKEIVPFAQSVAEYISLSGPFSENGGEFAGVNGYTVA